MLCNCLLCSGVHQDTSVLHWGTVGCTQSSGHFPPVSVLLLTPQADLQSGVLCTGLMMGTGERDSMKQGHGCVLTSWMFFFPAGCRPTDRGALHHHVPPVLQALLQCWVRCCARGSALHLLPLHQAHAAEQGGRGGVQLGECLLPCPSRSHTLGRLTEQKPFMGYSIWIKQVQLKNSLIWK